MTTYELIRFAIENKLQIIAVYQGHQRAMCPHVLGTKNGVEQALFYQFGGTSSRGKIEPDSTDNWRCIPIAGLVKAESRAGEWFTAENHSRAQTCVDDIDVEVDF